MSTPGRSQVRILRAKREGIPILTHGRSEVRILRAKREGVPISTPGCSEVRILRATRESIPIDAPDGGPAALAPAPPERGAVARRCARASLRLLATACTAVWALAAAPAAAAITPFSSAAPGVAPPLPWHVVTLPKIPRHTRFDVVEFDGATVLRVTADASYANLLHPLGGERAPRLRWRWRVEQPIEHADLTRKDGDDVPARVCVLFDLPLAHLRLRDRLRVEFGRALFDRDLPAASICYVWDRQLAGGTWLANAYTDRVQMLVLRQGGYGAWRDESRDLAADFARAFPHEARAGTPPLRALAVSADGDNTGGRSLAYFGDLVLEGQ